MELLSLALKSRVPLLAVKTEDTVYAPEVLSFMAGSPALPFNPVTQDLSSLKKDSVYYTSGAEASSELWLKFKGLGSTLVFLNTKKSALHIDCGTMFPPKEMVLQRLINWLGTPVAMEVLPAFGGLTLKEVFEVRKMAETEKGDAPLTTTQVNRIRRKMLTRTKGITQVDSESQFYDAPEYLETWVVKNKGLFLSPPHPKLMPRGLLFDGPPGTGKTAGAKYIADCFGMPLYRMDISNMKGKYVGESEGSLQAALTQVDQASPCVVLIDEIEKIFSQQSDQGVTTSMLGSLLWWLAEHQSQVLVVMTTNNRGKLPPELFREGRIDSVMTFDGLPKELAMEFATKLYEKLASEIGMKVPPTAWGTLSDALDSVQYPFAQSKATAMVVSMIKDQMTKEI